MKKIAIVGATGMVGRTILQVLEEYGLSQHEYTLLASARSANSRLSLFGREHTVQELTEQSFEQGFDIALFSAGGKTSTVYAPIAARHGTVAIDNSSAWRMDPEVPLVVPEVNPEDILWNKGIIANPNCSTIQAVVALAPLHRAYGIKRIIYSTYQSVSGAGREGWIDLENGIQTHVDGEDRPLHKFPYPIFNNCIPHIDVFMENGYTKEEQKMIEETRKILHDNSIAITATTVRVPVFSAHSESINIELSEPFLLEEVKDILSKSPGIILQDDPEQLLYPMAIHAAGRDDVFVGRVRRDESIRNGLNLWVVADNIRKGAASNAVQIARLLINNT